METWKYKMNIFFISAMLSVPNLLLAQGPLSDSEPYDLQSTVELFLTSNDATVKEQARGKLTKYKTHTFCIYNRANAATKEKLKPLIGDLNQERMKLIVQQAPAWGKSGRIDVLSESLFFTNSPKLRLSLATILDSYHTHTYAILRKDFSKPFQNPLWLKTDNCSFDFPKLNDKIDIFANAKVIGTELKPKSDFIVIAENYVSPQFVKLKNQSSLVVCDHVTYPDTEEYKATAIEGSFFYANKKCVISAHKSFVFVDDDVTIDESLFSAVVIANGEINCYNPISTGSARLTHSLLYSFSNVLNTRSSAQSCYVYAKDKIKLVDPKEKLNYPLYFENKATCPLPVKFYSISELGLEAQPSKLVETEIELVSIDPKSPFKEMKVKDRLLSVNGIEINSVKELRWQLRKASLWGQAWVECRRGAVRFQLLIDLPLPGE